MNFRYRLMQFMSGRNGTDALTFGLLSLAMAVSFTNIILGYFVQRLITAIIQLIVYGIIGYAIFRVLSRNIYSRQKENRWFIEKLQILKSKRETYNQRKADQFHIYKKCPNCKAVLRLPRRIGKHKTVCPRCQKEFSVRVKK